MTPLISSGLCPNFHTDSAGHEYSSEAVKSEAEGFRQAESATWDELEAMDMANLCLFVSIKPSRIHALVKGVDIHDEIAVDAAIRSGIQRMAPSLNDYCYLFARHLYRPLANYAEAAE